MAVEPSERLGAGHLGMADVMNHPWFEDLDWDAVARRRLSPPHFPVIEGPGDRTAYEIRLKMPEYRKVTMQEDSYFTEF